ncbi:hypothetical protein V4C53_47270, partial [Paraburkholderia azotifigens]|uniref:hypothetical protein n=1 Tax=Paraburkholderia azotifigens TaxID=2057004 RepID=UPI003170674B
LELCCHAWLSGMAWAASAGGIFALDSKSRRLLTNRPIDRKSSASPQGAGYELRFCNCRSSIGLRRNRRSDRGRGYLGQIRTSVADLKSLRGTTPIVGMLSLMNGLQER